LSAIQLRLEEARPAGAAYGGGGGLRRRQAAGVGSSGGRPATTAIATKGTKQLKRANPKLQIGIERKEEQLNLEIGNLVNFASIESRAKGERRKERYEYIVVRICRALA
jgi:hypothetical protein